MRNFFIILSVLLSSVSFVTSVYADSFNASVVVTKPITLAEKTALSFGSIVITDITSSHSIAMSSGGTVPSGTGFKVVGTPSEGEISIDGEPNTAANVTVVKNTTLSPSKGVTADPLDLTINIDGNSNVTLDSSGKATIKIIGTVVIPGDATAGIYSGQYTVTVAY